MAPPGPAGPRAQSCFGALPLERSDAQHGGRRVIRRALGMLEMPSAGRPTHLVPPPATRAAGAACRAGMVEQHGRKGRSECQLHATPTSRDLLTALASNLCVYAIAGAGRHLQAGCRALLSTQSRSGKHGVTATAGLRHSPAGPGWLRKRQRNDGTHLKVLSTHSLSAHRWFRSAT